jgi:inner membrane transporter RhtA
VSAVFHYLGPSLAVLLFARVDVLGVAWLRIVTAAVVFAAWRRPWRIIARLTCAQRLVMLALGAVLAAMNAVFYLAVDRLPLSTVSSIEFLGTIILAAIGARSRRNLGALIVTIGGVAVLTEVRVLGQPLGFAFAFANCAGFMLYVLLAHRVANTTLPASPATAVPDSETTDGPAPPAAMAGIDQLGAAMLVAAIVITPIGARGAASAVTSPVLLLAGAGVGICSSVVPYVTDQLAMARLPRATFALMLALLPAAATIMGLIVLRQVPTGQDLLGIALVIAGIAIHQDQGNAVGHSTAAVHQDTAVDHGCPRSRPGSQPARQVGKEARRCLWWRLGRTASHRPEPGAPSCGPSPPADPGFPPPSAMS